MSKIDDRGRPAGRPDDEPPGGLRRCLARFRAALQDRLWRSDEAWAAEREYTARRSTRGWSIEIRDPRFDRRHVCDTCQGVGHHHITGAECADCAGTGVVTDPERGEQA
jgi:hypothetical protein